MIRSENAINALRDVWMIHADNKGFNPDERGALVAEWNAICDVLGYADRFKL